MLEAGYDRILTTAARQRVKIRSPRWSSIRIPRRYGHKLGTRVLEKLLLRTR